ncbi:LOW QUALITY PROTEIN: diacylglycerol kinase [Psychrobacter sp. JCM 18902]|uniref:diacylglycerol kinase n=1 Tax=Psychrobacter sp. JCM 18902 TaxID=1298607 RepID=UPI000434F0AF|nr:diacylglycerol kinase [Psychrobacter sp. JCM 18902]GAF59495.1 LOW QUALITY PROTEIN: diacylglycerol kinase [Psychrobacter sp. JCM 18902]
MNKANPINLEDQSASRGVLSPITGKKQLLSHSYASEAKGKTGFYRIIKAAGYSLDGFKAAYKFEAAFRQVFWLNLILFTAIILCPFTISIKMLLVVASFLSLIVELINTGIEASVDHTSTAKHPLAKIAKDVGSAAQFLALMLLFILWMMALLSVVF